MILKVIDSLDKSETYVEISGERIEFGGWYLHMKKDKPISIELCDSEELAIEVNMRKNVYKKIIKSSKVLKDPWGYYLDNNMVNVNLGKNYL
jgi:hypothetical protein